jgi:sigma-B regulation protein RsbU (phosphoserine phosphatase)
MKYRWKLMILLLIISIAPMVGLRTFGIHKVRSMAATLSAQVKENRADGETPHHSRLMLETIHDRVSDIETMSAGFLIFLISVTGVLALLFSRTVTRPLDALAQAAQKLAAGEFKTRVNIRARDEFGDMGRIFNSVGPRLEAHYKMRQALDVANEIQQHLLPELPPQFPGLEIDGTTLYSDETGGDYFDYLCVKEQDREKLCVVVGDVAGHGIPAALLMATARGFLRLRASMPGNLSEAVADVNGAFIKDVERSGRFMTLFWAQIDRSRNRMDWVSAGHDPAILFDPKTDSLQNLHGKGMPLGVAEDAVYEEFSCNIKSGQIIFFGTDGIRETRNEKGEMFGKDRLQEIIRRSAKESAQTIKHAILDAVAEFRGNTKQEDDLTLVIIKVTEQATR